MSEINIFKAKNFWSKKCDGEKKGISNQIKRRCQIPCQSNQTFDDRFLLLSPTYGNQRRDNHYSLFKRHQQMQSFFFGFFLAT